MRRRGVVIEQSKLIEQLKDVFSSVPFPEHCGIRAAASVDGWNSDPKRLRAITEQEDLHKDWWELPASELTRYSIAISYFDSDNLLFYLPAYLLCAVESLDYRVVATLANLLNQPADDKDPVLIELFNFKFSQLTAQMKQTCFECMSYIESSYTGPRSDYLVDRFKEIQKQPFWSTNNPH